MQDLILKKKHKIVLKLKLKYFLDYLSIKLLYNLNILFLLLLL